MSHLDEIRQQQFDHFLRAKRDVEARREAKGYVNYGGYPLNSLESSVSFHDVEVAFIDREKLGSDVTFRSPSRLKEQGAGNYIKEDLPELVRRLESSDALEGWVEKIESKGIYANVKLSDRALFMMIRPIFELGPRYGESDALRGEKVMLEYSSMNAAKHLHAGHIRSTLVGHVLGNIYEASGATVHRVDYINDWGGMGYLLEGYRRWRIEFETAGLSGNNLLYAIYRRYRDLEAEGTAFEEFKKESAERFRKLEAGDADEVTLWSQMVSWSMEEFNEFYRRLNIFHDYTTFESMYAKRGDALVKSALEGGTAVIHEGAAVIPFGEDDRLVIRRSDDSSIYATRDLAALQHRVQTLDASRYIYVVGQEQSDYFSKLFRTAKLLSILDEEKQAIHVALGFYVNAETKKKLSSREGVSNVLHLLDEALAYFTAKYRDRGELSDEEIMRASKLLATGSLAFNEVKKESRFAVEIPADAKQAIAGFEASGGAYLMYTTARARSIRKKYGSPLPTVEGSAPKELEPVERELIKHLAEYPRFLVKSAEQNNPAVLAGFVGTLAEVYNSYYERCKVLGAEKELLFPHRLLITRAVEIVLDNGLKILHAEGPERI